MKGIKAFFTAGCLTLLSSCYVMSQAGPYLSHRIHAVSVKDLLARDDLDEDIRGMLEEVQKIRRFAEGELGLKGSKNYRDLVFLDRDYLAAVIQAAPEFSTDPYLFWYPFIGKQPYRGYFDPEDARSQAHKLEADGLDVFIRKVDAFSSLGFFKDPLYSFMAEYSTRRLAELIIHEETHATVFFKRYPDFNEKLASVIGVQGASLYMNMMYPGSSVENESESRKRDDFNKDVLHLAGDLDELYSSPLSPEEMRLKKRALLKAFEERWDLSYEINNAFVSLFKLYEEPDNRVLEAYERLGSISALVELCLEAEKDKGDPWALISGINLIN